MPRRLLFPNPYGSSAIVRAASGPIVRSGVLADLKAVRIECGIHKYQKVHSLRHAYGTNLLELGVDLRVIQVLLGHRWPETKVSYAHLTEVNQDQAKGGSRYCWVASICARRKADDLARRSGGSTPQRIGANQRP